MGPNLDPVRDQLGDYNGQKYRLNWWYPGGLQGPGAQDPVWDLGADRSRRRALKLPAVPALSRATESARRARVLLLRSQGPGARRRSPAGRSRRRLGTGRAVARGLHRRGGCRAARRRGRAAAAACELYRRRPGRGAPAAREPKGVARRRRTADLRARRAAGNRVTVFNPDGTIATIWGRLAPATASSRSRGVSPSRPNGEVFVADTWNHRIQKFDRRRPLPDEVGRPCRQLKRDVSAQPGIFWGPRPSRSDPTAYFYVTDTGNKRIQVFDPNGHFVRASAAAGHEPASSASRSAWRFDGDRRWLWPTPGTAGSSVLDRNGAPLGFDPDPGLGEPRRREQAVHRGWTRPPYLYHAA